MHAPTVASQGLRSASVSGCPPRIFAMFAAGCRASASVKGQPSLPASSEPTVDLPLPDTPATTTIMAASLLGPRAGPQCRTLAAAPRGGQLPLLGSGWPRDGGGAVPAVSNQEMGCECAAPCPWP